MYDTMLIKTTRVSLFLKRLVFIKCVLILVCKAYVINTKTTKITKQQHQYDNETYIENKQENKQKTTKKLHKLYKQVIKLGKNKSSKKSESRVL